MSADLSRRVAAIESRLDALESEEPPTPAVWPDEQFWALNALKERITDPGAVLFTGAVTLPGEERYEWQEGRTVDQLLGQDWADLAPSLAALGHPVRLMIMQEIAQGRHSTHELTADDRFGTSGQLYHHLRQLVGAGWLKQSGRGRYLIPPERVNPLLVLLLGADR